MVKMDVVAVEEVALMAVVCGCGGDGGSGYGSDGGGVGNNA